ncbi:hypothetical protein [Lysobacter gummosus]|uniref:hypothetical protein n=1 Tax=Lysobacter gummosus TaxID=262324 RepID=UPI00362ACE91
MRPPALRPDDPAPAVRRGRARLRRVTGSVVASGPAARAPSALPPAPAGRDRLARRAQRPSLRPDRPAACGPADIELTIKRSGPRARDATPRGTQ